MGYMKEIDRQVRETIDAIIGIIARYFPESEWREGGWELEIEQQIYHLAQSIIQMRGGDKHARSL